MSEPRWTPTQQRILDVLSDGRPHDRDELLKCLWDDLSGGGALRQQVYLIRSVLRAVGEDIVCEFGWRRTIRYRHVRLLTAPKPVTNPR
jgi:hypothetical protein